ncbi:MAG: ABC transporter substrate-binding protein, partial [Stellaceae bacterium]
ATLDLGLSRAHRLTGEATMCAKFLVLASALMLAIAAGPAKADPVHIRLSYIVPVANWATILFQKPELAPNLDKTYTFEAVHFANTSLTVQGLAAGEIEIANIGYTTLPLLIENAGVADARVIADELQDGVPGYYSDQFLVVKDSPIKRFVDLRGKVLADGGIGSGLDIPIRAMGLKYGMKDKRDFTIVEAPIPALSSELLQRKVDLIAIPLPFTASPQIRAGARTLFTQADAMGVTELGFWVARTPFLEKNHAALIDFMTDALREEHWYEDPAHHDEAVQIAVRVSKLPAGIWDSWLFRKDGQNGDYYRPPDGKPNIASLQASIDEQQKLGFFKTTFDVRKYVDLSLVDAAAKRLH